MYELTIDCPPEAEVGQEIAVVGKLFKDGKGVPGVRVSLFINGKRYATKITGKDGEYIFKVKFDKPGRYEIYTEAYPEEGIVVPSKKIGALMAIGAAVVGIVGAAVMPKKKEGEVYGG